MNQVNHDWSLSHYRCSNVSLRPVGLQVLDVDKKPRFKSETFAQFQFIY